MIRIAIAGDVCAAGLNEDAFRRGDAAALFGAAGALLQDADLAIANLESPLYREPRPIRKSGPVLGVPDDCVRGFVAGGFDILGLANNHAMDHSREGLENTIRVLADHGIACVGAGSDLAAARWMHVHEVDGLRIGVLAMAEREFGLAGRDRPGVNPLDLVDWMRTVRERRGDHDFLIVLLHGGNEHLQVPRPSLVETCRFLVEEGADVVLCQHSHCVGCVEQYGAGHIVYGQGNFVFGASDVPPTWREGVLVVLEIDAERRELELVPVVQTQGVPGVDVAPAPARERILEGIEARSGLLADPAALEEHWRAFCNERKTHYLRRLGSRRRWQRAVDRLIGNVQGSYARSWALRAEHLNLIRCESHREVLIEILSEGFE